MRRRPAGAARRRSKGKGRGTYGVERGADVFNVKIFSREEIFTLHTSRTLFVLGMHVLVTLLTCKTHPLFFPPMIIIFVSPHHVLSEFSHFFYDGNVQAYQ